MPIRPISTSDRAQIEEAAGFGANIARKALTFDDTDGAPVLFTVTGDVIVRVVAVVVTSVASAGACNGAVGIAGATTTIIANTDVTLLAAREIWHDAMPDVEIEALSVMKDFIITDGNDIILTLSAQADSGALAVYCMWTPLSADGLVVAA